MIVIERNGGLTCVTQGDHARFAAEILSLWRSRKLLENPHREEILFAVREHDNGWLEADAAPRVDPATGWPCDFRCIPDAAKMEILRRGVERHLETRPQAALMIILHALTLHRSRAERPEWRGFLRWVEDLRGSLVETLGFTPEILANDYSWLLLGDRITLAFFERDSNRGLETADGKIAVRAGESELILRPLPLAGPTTFHIPIRQIPATTYPGDQALGTALAEAKWKTWGVRVTDGRKPVV